jgi:hypothetical protein
MKPQPTTFYLPEGGRVLAIPTGDLSANFQLGIDTPITGLVLGQPRRRVMLGSKLFRFIPVPTIRFSYTEHGLEAFVVKDAKRPMRSQIQYSHAVLDQIPDKLERYSWASLLDQAERANAGAFDARMGLNSMVQRKHAILAQRIVEMSVESLRATVGTAAASYSQSAPDLDVSLSSGSEFNHGTGGDAKLAIRTLASTLAAANGVGIADIDVYMTRASFEAAQDDPVYNTRRGNFATDVPSEQELATYYGVNSVVVGDAEATTDGLTVTSLWGDVTILRINVPGSEYDTEEGQGDSFCEFASAPLGAALEPWYEPGITSWATPWEQWTAPRQVSVTSAAIIRNCAL